jgi:hypothetical protein
MTLMHPSSGNFSTSPFASPASSEGAPSVRLSGNPFVHSLGFGSGVLDLRERDSADALAGGYFSADTLDARDFGLHQQGLHPHHQHFARPQLDATRSYGAPTSLTSMANMNSLLFDVHHQQQQQQQQQQQIFNRFGTQGMPSPLPSLMMLSAGHPFLQEQRASNENTPMGSPRAGHGGGLGEL